MSPKGFFFFRGNVSPKFLYGPSKNAGVWPSSKTNTQPGWTQMGRPCTRRPQSPLPTSRMIVPETALGIRDEVVNYG